MLRLSIMELERVNNPLQDAILPHKLLRDSQWISPGHGMAWAGGGVTGLD